MSRAFLARRVEIPRTVLHAHNAPVLDQGKIGSCTGHTMAQALNTEYFNAARKTGVFLNDSEAVALYSAASFLDDIPGGYLPDDTGSSGLAVAKAAKERGYIAAYHHAFGFDQMIQALMVSPLLIGTNWYNSFFNPDANGFVTFDGGSPLGGHEYLCLGVDMENQYLTFLNSWGSSWGIGGRFKISFPDFKRLLSEDGDVVAPVAG